MASTYVDLGSKLTAAAGVHPSAEWGRQIRTNQESLHKPPIVTLTNSTLLAPSTSTWTSATFDTAAVDNDNMHSPSTNPSRVTVNQPGLYQAHGYGKYAAASQTGQRGIRILKDGVDVVVDDVEDVLNSTTVAHRSSVTGSVVCSTGNYLEVQFWHNTTGSPTITTEFQVYRVTGTTD